MNNSDENDLINWMKNRRELNSVSYSNPLHPNMRDKDYEDLREVYYPIQKLYQHFFARVYKEGDIESTNSSLIEELSYVGIRSMFSFEDEAAMKAYKDVIMSAAYPASYHDMMVFLFEVLTNENLTFMKKFPIGYTTPFGLLESDGLDKKIYSYMSHKSI